MQIVTNGCIFCFKYIKSKVLCTLFLSTGRKGSKCLFSSDYFDFSKWIDLFTTTVYINQTTNSPLMTNTSRGVQPINSRIVMSQVVGTKTTGLIKPTSGTKTTSHVKPTSTANPSLALSFPLLRKLVHKMLRLRWLYVIVKFHLML